MEWRDIEKARIALRNAGVPADRHQLRSTLISQLGKRIETLKRQKEMVACDYRRNLERWRSEDIPENVPVCALPSDVHDSRVYRLTGLFALLCEMALAAWVFYALGVGWWMGVLMGLGVTLTLHGVFLHVFDDRERPKQSIYRIRRLASLPAVFGFLIALALGVLARYVHGSLAVALLPAFSISLWLGTLSLLILAASLFTLAHILGWSARYQDQHRKLEHEERASSAFLDELRVEAGPRATPAIEAEAMGSLSTHSSPGKRNGEFVAGAVLALALITGTSCSTVASSANAQKPEIRPDNENAILQIFVDTSGSCVRPALEESWNTLRRELPDVIETRHISKVTLWQFDVDGWSPRRLADLALPTRQLPTRARSENTEWASFSNIRDAIDEADDREWHRDIESAQQKYRRSRSKNIHPVVFAAPDFAWRR
jgi:hypothetical protein